MISDTLVPPYLIVISVDASGRAETTVTPAMIPPEEADDDELSANFSWSEALYSSTAESCGIANDPDSECTARIKAMAQAMERVRELLGGNPIVISSWFRCEALNEAVGGSSTSEHMLGRAVDFTCPGYGSVYDACARIAADPDLPFNQLIYENHGASKWIHLSFKLPPGKREVLTIDSHGTHAGLVA